MKHIWVFAAFLLLVVTGCTAEWVIPEDYYVECESNADCPDSAECMLTDDGTARVCVTDGRTECGNGVQEAGETCDDGDDNTLEYGVAGRCNPDCDGYAPHCGDGAVNGGESCDQGAANTDAYGAEGSCNLECSGLAPHCGDGVVNGGEVCDAGAANTDAYGLISQCNSSCTGYAGYCGDGFIDTEENCDDGDDNTDVYGELGRCNLDCDGYAPSCGDGAVNGGESCDQGAANTDAYGTEGSCNLECSGLAPHCGDGVVNGGEVCDLGAANSDVYGNSEGCLTTCAGPPAYCGDGLTNGGEVCDDGNTEDGDYCSASCQAVTTICGDGQVQGSEVCDDGASNTSSAYTLEQTCNDSCSDFTRYCGDGFINGDEDCDDGNQIDDGNGCSADCTRCTSLEQCPQSGEVVCGDDEVHTAFENCDDGNSETEGCPYGTPLCYVCNASCQVQDRVGAYCGDGIVQQRGLIGGTTLFTGTLTDGEDTGEWEGCDPGSEDNPTPAVSCSSLYPALGSGMASCAEGCVKYDTSGCSNQSVVYVPSGPFMMGCNEVLDGDCDSDESPYHEVHLDAYVIDKTEVTASAFMSCVDNGDCSPTGSDTNIDCYSDYSNFDWGILAGYHVKSERENHPANCMRWFDAEDFCTAQNMRLPTEAEWEKAARGTDGRVFPWGLALPTCERAVVSGWYNDPVDGWIEGYGCGKDRTWAVGSILAGVSPYGAMDMAGNVWEWVSDWYGSDYYNETSNENPEGPLTGSYRVLRGGSFFSTTFHLRASGRYFHNPDYRFHDLGFRCAQ